MEEKEENRSKKTTKTLGNISAEMRRNCQKMDRKSARARDAGGGV